MQNQFLTFTGVYIQNNRWKYHKISSDVASYPPSQIGGSQRNILLNFRDLIITLLLVGAFSSLLENGSASTSSLIAAADRRHPSPAQPMLQSNIETTTEAKVIPGARLSPWDLCGGAGIHDIGGGGSRVLSGKLLHVAGVVRDLCPGSLVAHQAFCQI